MSLGRRRKRPLEDGCKSIQVVRELSPPPPPPKKVKMNGHGSKILDAGRFSASSNSVGKSSSSSSSHTSIASLCNLGNTCFLNSVLYTLRFTPGFLHNLHHLASDLGLGLNPANGKDKKGRHANGQITRSNAPDAETERVHDVIEQLHDLFRTMSSSDDHLLERESNSSSSREPIPPSNFLHAVGKMNSRFEGNQQQDAHELWIDLLTMLSDVKVPSPSTATTQTTSPQPHSEDEDVVDTARKSEKKKGKKSFLSNGHSLGSTGVKLVSSTPRTDASLPPTSSVSNGKLPAEEPAEDAFNFVRENFAGKIVHRTKCLECETSTYRPDKFNNVDIPLSFDDELETMSNGFDETGSSTGSRSGNTAMSVADLFLKQIMASDTLRENNKYLCTECSRYNEAQRSVQYELLPKVLVLQLKRFTAANTKINDFVPTPFTMNCFCTQCLPPDGPQPPGERMPPKHHYRLFAVIMHLGATLASGHYIAYVRASVDLNVDYSRCQTSSPPQLPSSSKSLHGMAQPQPSNGKRGIMKYFSRNSDNGSGVSSSSSSKNGHAVGSNGVDLAPQPQVPSHCRSANCCGMQRVLGQLNNHSSQQPRQRQKSQESLDNGGGSSSNEDSALPMTNGQMEDVWLECDDENISVISRRQFEDELNSKQSATTPYLLFYERV